jgi:hypothetical protein
MEKYRGENVSAAVIRSSKTFRRKQGWQTDYYSLLQEEIEKYRWENVTAAVFRSSRTFRSSQGILTGCHSLVQEEIEKYRGENVTADSERHRELSQLEERLSETQEQAAWYQHKHQAAVKRVDQLKVHIHSHTHSRTDPAP